ncbi:site-specific integrase [Acinetobacter indicus]|uniref:site-specific integrase n=1 Tax=Acinetobacter TaxID=469 RepID=UPI0025789ACC|nr:site-specific integrase [Acinetobacter indicus]MDM1269247.1 site-specific integrase [Acinetobacter indicus]
MNSEAKLDVLTNFAEHRFDILNSLNSTRNQNIECSQLKNRGSTKYMDLLMHKPVSKLSKFSDQIWDFNKDYPNAARNVQGAKLRIDFTKYKDVPIFVLTEIKIILELALLNNLIFKPQHTGPRTRSRVKGIIKANSLIPYFESGLTFINEIFKQANNELGYEFVQTKIRTLSDIGPELYYKAAANYERVKGRELDQFFGYLRNPASLKYVFEKPIAYVELNSLPWNKLANVVKEKKEQVLPDQVFETLSKVASFIVVDFLNAIGDRDRISDIHTLERFNTSNYSSWASQAGITQEVLNGYIALRLKNKGYSSNFIKNLTSPYNWMIDSDSNIKHGSALREVLINRGYTLVSLRDYFNLLSYSCLYLVGQYTGMRPSELAEVQVQNSSCLIEENGIWLIESAVKKHKEEISTGLFDDRWVAIPIVRDAILAASYIAQIKASPYLASSVSTVPSDSSPCPMDSNGIIHQMNIFIRRLLGERAVNEVNFNPYMLRHTLTYQLFKAEVGLPLISFQLKHFVDSVSKFTFDGATSSVTLGYGDIGEMLSKDGNRKGSNTSLRRTAELEAIKTAHNPHGIYYGGKANEHRQRLIKMFQGYMAEGHTEDEVYEALVNQGVAVVYMGQGLCYGGREEEYDSSLPCIGSLRCNPARCKQAVVTSKHAPKWREVYILNKANLNKPEYSHNREQIMAAMNEAKMVLEYLGEAVEL